VDLLISPSGTAQMAPKLSLSKLEFIRDMIFSGILTTLQIAKAAECSERSVTTIRSNLQVFGCVRVYLHNLLSFYSYYLVFVDESGCDKRVGFRRTGWAPLGVTPAQVSQFHRGQRYQILPAYAQDGVVLSRVFQGSTNASLFEDFIAQLLEHCGRWPDPKSMLVMDNASFHHSERIEQMCTDAGVKLVYLPPYSPDLNPIEEFFAELKGFIKRNWQHHMEHSDEGFDSFLEWCIDIVGAREQSAKGHFRHAGLVIDEI
jgi:transposase/DNA-binding CsgD family transcriptional regulator